MDGLFRRKGDPKAPQSPKKPPRAGFLDEWRGVALICMLLYHTFYDLYAIFGVPLPLFSSPFYILLQRFIGYSFIVISGISCAYSRSNLRRGIIVFALALGMTIVTLLAMPEQRILFGVLHFLGLSMILAAVLHPLLERIPTWAGIAGSLLLFAATSRISWGRLGIGTFSVGLPSFLYRTNLLFPLGFHNASFFSSDYYPLLPWFFLFLAGVFWGRIWRAGKCPGFVYQTHIPPLAAVGRRTILIYVVHQPVIYLVLTVWFRLFQPS